MRHLAVVEHEGLALVTTLHMPRLSWLFYSLHWIYLPSYLNMDMVLYMSHSEEMLDGSKDRCSTYSQPRRRYRSIPLTHDGSIE